MENIDYSEGLKLDVRANIGIVENLEGTLVVGNKILPTLTIVNTYSTDEPALMGFLKCPPDSIICTSKGKVYTLYQNSVRGRSFLPAYIVCGVHAGNVRGVDISLSGLYSFFNGRSYLQFKNSYIGKEIFDSFIEIPFFIADEQYSFSVWHDFHHTKKIDVTTLTEDAIVRVEKNNGSISMDEARDITKKIRILFSLLLGFDLSIRKTWFVTDDGYRGSSFYFPAHSKSEQPFEHAHYCFISSHAFISGDLWSMLLNNAFNGKEGKALSEFWVRLVNMFSFKGFWEYEILGIVSILDAYSSNHYKKNAPKGLPKNEFSKLRASMKKVLNSYKDTLSGNDNYVRYSEVIDSMASHLDEMNNSKTRNFRGNFEFLMESLNCNVRNLIDFEEKDFNLIKEVRDAAAHSQPIGARILADLQRLVVVKNKVMFLLLYISHKSLGFTDEGFIRSCASSFHRIKNDAQLDNYTLDILSGLGVAFEVSNDMFSKASGVNKLGVTIIHHVKSNEFEVDNKALESLERSYDLNIECTHKSKVEFIYSYYQCSEIFSVEYLSSLYLCSAAGKIRFSASCLIRENN